MGDVIKGPFLPGERAGNGGDGPEEPMLENRVQSLEQRADRIEQKLDRIEAMLTRLEPRITEMLGEFRQMPKAAEHATLRSDVAEVKGRLAGLELAIRAIPTTWTIVGILSAMLIGIAGIVFAAGNLLKP